MIKMRRTQRGDYGGRCTFATHRCIIAEHEFVVTEGQGFQSSAVSVVHAFQQSAGTRHQQQRDQRHEETNSTCVHACARAGGLYKEKLALTTWLRAHSPQRPAPLQQLLVPPREHSGALSFRADRELWRGSWRSWRRFGQQQQAATPRWWQSRRRQRAADPPQDLCPPSMLERACPCAQAPPERRRRGAAAEYGQLRALHRW